MGSEPVAGVDPLQLIFPFLPGDYDNRPSSSIRLNNTSRNHLAYKLMSNNHTKYGVRPRIGIMQPESTLDITVTTTRATSRRRRKDKFVIQTVAFSPGPLPENAREIFERGRSSHGFREYELRVVFLNPVEIVASLDPVVVEISNSFVSQVTTSQPDHSCLQRMSSTKLLDIKPSEIQFPFEMKEELSSSLQLTNTTEYQVAFMVETRSPNHSVEPRTGLISPRSSTSITVKMRLNLEIPSRVKIDDKLLIRSIVVVPTTTNDATILAMFDETSGSSVREYEVRINYNSLIVESIIRGIVFVLMSIVSWYLMRRTVSFIWSLVMMVKRLVSDSIEDWIVKTLLYLCMHLIYGRKAKID